MLQVKRLELITKILEQNGSVNVNDLSEQFKVTSKTIRKDLETLEEMGLLERVHGGAVVRQSGNSVFPIAERKQKNTEYKEKIGSAALKYIEDGDIIIMDGGTTTLQLAKMIGDKRITVVVNDLIIAGELMHKEKITLYVVGGKLRREGAYTLLGRDAERGFEKYQVRKLFLATSALDFEKGLMVLSSDEAEVKRVMIDSAREIICLADYSKFHTQAFVSFCGLEKISTIITDSRITPEDRAYLENKGIKLDIV